MAPCVISEMPLALKVFSRHALSGPFGPAIGSKYVCGHRNFSVSTPADHSLRCSFLPATPARAMLSGVTSRLTSDPVSRLTSDPTSHLVVSRRAISSFFVPGIKQSAYKSIDSWAAIKVDSLHSLLYLAHSECHTSEHERQQHSGALCDGQHSKLCRLDLPTPFFISSPVQTRLESALDAVRRLPVVDCYLLLLGTPAVGASSRQPISVNMTVSLSALTTVIISHLMATDAQVRTCSLKRLVRCARAMSLPFDSSAIYSGSGGTLQQLSLALRTFDRLRRQTSGGS